MFDLTLLNRKFLFIQSSFLPHPYFYSCRKHYFLILYCPILALTQVLVQPVSLFSLVLLDSCMPIFEKNQTEKTSHSSIFLGNTAFVHEWKKVTHGSQDAHTIIALNGHWISDTHYYSTRQDL